MNLSSQVDGDTGDSSLLGKFRNSLKKKVSLKRLSDMVKSPAKASSKKDKHTNGEAHQEPEQHDGTEDHDLTAAETDHGHDFSGSIDIETHDEIVELPPAADDEPDGSAAKKKKKKKKRRPAAEVDAGDEPLDADVHGASVEVSYSAAVPGSYARNADASYDDADDVENSNMSIDRSREVHHEVHQEEIVVVTTTTESKKTRRKGHKSHRKNAEETEEL
jgi:hypothetical protein